RPVIIALNMMDMAAAAGLKVDAAELEGELGVPVIPCEAVHGKGLVGLRLAMSRADLPLARHRWDVPAPVAPAVAELQAALTDHDGRPPLIARAEALLLLTDLDSVRVAGSRPLSERTREILAHWRQRWEGEGADWAAALIRSRYDAIGALCKDVVTRTREHGPSRSDRIDAVLCHSVWGWAVFGAIMVALFYSIFSLAERPMGFIDGHVAAFGGWVKGVMTAGDLRDLLT